MSNGPWQFNSRLSSSDTVNRPVMVRGCPVIMRKRRKHQVVESFLSWNAFYQRVCQRNRNCSTRCPSTLNFCGAGDCQSKEAYSISKPISIILYRFTRDYSKLLGSSTAWWITIGDRCCYRRRPSLSQYMSTLHTITMRQRGGKRKIMVWLFFLTSRSTTLVAKESSLGNTYEFETVQ